MTADNFMKYITENAKLSTKELDALKKITEKYPYFQTAHALYIQAAKNVGNDEFLKSLETSSAFVSNREHLYYMISGLETKKIATKKATNSTKEALEILNKNKKQEPFVQKSATKTKQELPDSKTLKNPIKVVKETSVKEQTKEKEKKEPAVVKTNKVQVTVKPQKETVSNQTEKKQKTTSEERHNSLINDFFADRTRQQKDSKKEKTPTVSNEKTQEITAETEKNKKQITDDIFAKIEALKNEKPISENKENTILEKVVTKDKVYISEPQKEKKTIETPPATENKNVRKVVIVTEKREPIKPIKTTVKKILPKEELISKITENKTNATPETTKQNNPIVVSKVPNKEVSGTEKSPTPQAENKKEETNEQEETKKIATKPTAQELINKFISQAKEENKSADKQTDKQTVTVKEQKTKQQDNDTKLSTKKAETEAPVQNEKKNAAADNLMARIAALKNKKAQTTEKQNDLINKFVEDAPSLDTSKEPEISGDVSEESTKAKEEVITELMASIYINQGHTDKAIAVYEKLILKNPEKKSYFANLISELKKDEI